MAPKIVDAEFEVVDGPLRPGDRHPEWKAFVFSGHYDNAGEPIFVFRKPWINRHPWLTVALIVLAWNAMQIALALLR